MSINDPNNKLAYSDAFDYNDKNYSPENNQVNIGCQKTASINRLALSCLPSVDYTPDHDKNDVGYIPWEKKKDNVITETSNPETTVKIASRKSKDERSLYLRERYHQIPAGKTKLSEEHWVKMRLKFERKIDRTFKHIKQIGSGLKTISKQKLPNGMAPKGKILREAYQVEAILPEHYLPDNISRIIKEWKASPDETHFVAWIKKNKPEIAASEKVSYFSAEERSLKALSLRVDGRFTKAHSENEIYSTNNEKTVVAIDSKNHEFIYKNGKAMYVVGPDQTFYATSQQIGEVHHSSLLSGGAVIGAGEFSIDSEGKLTSISNKSGHYRPGEDNMQDVLQILQGKNVDLSKVKLEIVTPAGIATFSSAKEYLDKKGQCLPKFRGTKVSLDKTSAKEGVLKAIIFTGKVKAEAKIPILKDYIARGFDLTNTRLLDNEIRYESAMEFLKART